MTAIIQLLTLVDAYRAATDLAEATVSSRVFFDGKRIASLRSGGDVGAMRLDRAIQWFSDNWPANAVWPADVPRPAPMPVKEAAE
jgi:hypothetical protein